MHVFVVPDVDGPVTGGTLFNRMLIAGLQQSHVAGRACSKAMAGDALSRAASDDVFWVDSLFLDLLPTLARMPRRALLGLLLHYLPSLVAPGAGDGSGSALTALETDALASADAILVPSPYLREVVLRAVDPPPPIAVLEPGRLSRGPVESCAPPVRGVMVANLLPGKGVVPFLRNLSEQVSASDRYQLSIVGGAGFDADYAHECERAVEDNRLRGHVRLLGEQSPEATVEHMASCNLFVSASAMESYGMALAEARCLGLPIVAQRGGNVQRLVTEESGGEVVMNTSALAQAVLRLCREPVELRRRMQAARTNALLPRRWTTVAAEYVDAVAKLRAVQSSALRRVRDVCQ